MVVMRGFHHVVNGVVLIADAAKHEAADAFVKRDFIVSISIGYHAFVDDFPVDVHPRNGSAVAVFVLFINRTFDKALGQGTHSEGK